MTRLLNKATRKIRDKLLPQASFMGNDRSYTLHMPIQTASESNMRGHWGTKDRRRNAQIDMASLCVLAGYPRSLFSRTYRVELCRLGPKPLDPGNLEASFKFVQDAIARVIGIDDGKLEWKYTQEKTVCLYGVKAKLMYNSDKSNTDSTLGSGP